MSDTPDRPPISTLVTDLVRSLRTIRRELESPRGSRGRGLDRLFRFTSEVTIPAAILLLETNIRALVLLQRAFRLAEDPDADRGSSDASALGQTVVDRIDDALADVQTAVENASIDERTQDSVTEARELNDRLATRLEDESGADEQTASVDVDAELESLKDEFEDGNGSDDEE
jgi:hypothetical protein